MEPLKKPVYLASPIDIGADIFARGCCPPSDNKMTIEGQDAVIEAIKLCFENSWR